MKVEVPKLSFEVATTVTLTEDEVRALVALADVGTEAILRGVREDGDLAAERKQSVFKHRFGIASLFGHAEVLRAYLAQIERVRAFAQDALSGTSVDEDV